MNKQKQLKRATRVRKQLRAAGDYPRLSVFRSNAHIWSQIIDDQKGITLAAFSDKSIKQGTKIEKATKVGEEIAKLALKAGVKQVVFDRGPYRFHGRVKAIAEAARSAGLKI